MTRPPKCYRVVLLEPGKRPRYAQIASYPRPYEIAKRMTPAGRYARREADAVARRIRQSRYWRGVRVKVEEAVEPAAWKRTLGEAA